MCEAEEQHVYLGTSRACGSLSCGIRDVISSELKEVARRQSEKKYSSFQKKEKLNKKCQTCPDGKNMGRGSVTAKSQRSVKTVKNLDTSKEHGCARGRL